MRSTCPVQFVGVEQMCIPQTVALTNQNTCFKNSKSTSASKKRTEHVYKTQSHIRLYKKNHDK